jgi:hypothetical protein
LEVVTYVSKVKQLHPHPWCARGQTAERSERSVPQVAGLSWRTECEPSPGTRAAKKPPGCRLHSGWRWSPPSAVPGGPSSLGLALGWTRRDSEQGLGLGVTRGTRRTRLPFDRRVSSRFHLGCCCFIGSHFPSIHHTRSGRPPSAPPPFCLVSSCLVFHSARVFVCLIPAFIAWFASQLHPSRLNS